MPGRALHVSGGRKAKAAGEGRVVEEVCVEARGERG